MAALGRAVWPVVFSPLGAVTKAQRALTPAKSTGHFLCRCWKSPDASVDPIPDAFGVGVPDFGRLGPWMGWHHLPGFAQVLGGFPEIVDRH